MTAKRRNPYLPQISIQREKWSWALMYLPRASSESAMVLSACASSSLSDLSRESK